MKVLVICHFYNEEYLLPFWLDHHTKLFDHGIMINNGSTDRSVEIIKEYAPDWKIIDSKLNSFDALALDCIVQQQEMTWNGWKICLNVSEFITNDLRRVIEDAERKNIYALETKPFIMFDPNENIELIASVPLLVQKPFGFYDNALYDFLMRDQKLRKLFHLLLFKKGSYKRRARLLHRHLLGGYSPGRHNWFHKSCRNDDLKMYWYGFSPSTKDFVKRKLSFGETLPDEQQSLGRYHNIDRNKLKIIFLIHKVFFKIFGTKLDD